MSHYGPKPWVQRHWDWRAAVNFMLGGSGSGLLVAAALTGPSRAILLLGLGLIAAGLAAVWLETGRKLRAAHVFFNPRTSWMTRESLAAVILFASGFSYFAWNESWIQYATALAAFVFVVCQAQILRAAKGIPAWRAPEVVPLVLTTAFAEGLGICSFFSSDLSVAALLALAVLARALAWSRYRAALRQPDSRAALEAAGKALVQFGTVAPLALLLAGTVVPEALPLAGLAALITGWRFKFVLVARAAFNQGFSLQHLPIR